MSDVAANNMGSGRENPPPSGLLPAGTRLGKYRVDEMVGAGGMAITYRGFDTMLARAVAIKQIASNLASNPKWCEHFRKEAQTVAQLTDARNVVRIYELLTTKQGLFLILEYVDGRPLEELIEGDTLGVQASLEIIWNVALGLRSIHAKSIVHRDIKPANILVPPNRKAKIVDFGISGRWGVKTSSAIGTTRYMAPERFREESVDGRCDIYSLGIVGFEMLVGRARFNELFADVLRDPASQSVRWMNWHTKLGVTLPRADKINPDVPPLVADVIAKMVAKSLGDRYKSVDELVADMKTRFAVPRGTLAAMATGHLLLDGDLTTGVLPNRQTPAEKRARRVRAATAAGVVALLLAVGGAAWWVHSITRRNAEAARHGAVAQEAFARALGEGDSQQSFATAASEWGEVALADPNGKTEAGREAQRYLPLAQAYLAIARKEYNEAERGIREAEEREAPASVVRPIRQKLDAERRVNLALMRIDTSLENNAFDEADEALADLAQAAPQHPNLAEHRRRADMARRVFAFNKHVAEGRAALANGKYDEARDAYQAAQRTVGPSDESRLKEVQGLLAEVDGSRRFDEAMRIGKEAEAAGKWDVAAARFEEARKLRPGRNAESLFTHAKARALVAEAAGRKAIGDMRAAYDKYKAASDLDPSFDEAKRGLEALARIDEWDPLVKQANEAFGAGHYAEALESYRKAGAIIPTTPIDERIRLCEFGRLMADGDAAMTRREWTAAETAYKEAAKHGSQSDVDRKIDALRVEKEYAGAMSDGDDALRVEDFRKAKTSYERAKKVKPGPEIEDKLKNLEYARNLATGNKAIQAKNYTGAMMWFRKAQSIRDTDEVRRRIEEAQSHITPGP